MYKAFFGLAESPFSINPDPRFLYHTREIDEALACLTHGIRERRGFIRITGEVGTGKTTLLNKLLDWLRGERVATAFIFNPRLTVSEFLELMLADFGIECNSNAKSRVLWRLNHWLLERYQAGDTVVLIVDEAQCLSLDLLEEIRLLTNLETATEKLLQIVLCGQLELDQRLNQPQLRQLRQRITLSARTRPLTKEETHGYVNARLRIAGARDGPVFTAGATDAVHRHSRGIPRVINLICEHALIAAFVDGHKPVPAETVEAVASELDLIPDEPWVAAPSSPEIADLRLLESLHQLGALIERLRRPEHQESKPVAKRSL